MERRGNGQPPQGVTHLDYFEAIESPLRRAAYEALNKVRSPLPNEQRSLEGIGWVFLPVHAKSLVQVARETPDYFEFITGAEGPRNYVPPEMTAAIHPEHLALRNSYGRRPDDQLFMIEKLSQYVQRELPDARALMLPASAIAQLVIAFQEKTGRNPIGGFYVRGLDQAGMMSGPIRRFTIVGHEESKSKKLIVDTTPDIGGFPDIAALPAVIFVRSK